MNRIKLTQVQRRPLSWSSISSFEYDPEAWYRKYILNEKPKETIEMAFGKKFAKSIEDGKPLAPVTYYNRTEYPFNVVFNNIPLIGFADIFDDVTKKKMREIKTGKKEWSQKRVDDSGQITMYVLCNYITNKIKPEEMTLHLDWYPTQIDGDFKVNFIEPIVVRSFETKRTMSDILRFGAKINSIIKEMDYFVQEHL